MGCPGGMSTVQSLAQYLRALLGPIFLQVFLGKDCNGKKDRCTAFGCNNGRLFPEKYSAKFSFLPVKRT